MKKIPDLPKDNNTDETKNDDDKDESGSIKDGTGPAPGAFYI